MTDSRDTLAELRAFTQRLRDKYARWSYLQRRIAEHESPPHPLFSARYGYGWPRDFTLPHVTDEDD